MEHETTTRDRGAALLLAIVVVTGVSVAIAAALGFAATSVSSSANSYRPARHALYGADAAVKLATKYIAANPTAGSATGTTCIATNLSAGTINGSPVAIQVCPESGSFTQVSDLEAYSLIALGNDSDENGIDISTVGNGNDNDNDNDNGNDNGNANGLFFVNGKVHSNNDLSIDDRFTVTNGNVSVRGTCSTSKITVDSGKTKTCSSSSVASVARSTVALDPVVTEAIPDADSPDDSCGSSSGSNKIAVMHPGKYTSAPSIDTDCRYLWLEPGVYYFEGVDWTIDLDTVAGALASGRTTPISSDFSGFADNCDTSKPDDGVEIILGDDSTITIDGGTLEVCGRTHGEEVVAVYGPTEDLEAESSVTTAKTSDPSNTSNTSGWTNSSDGRVINGTSATRSISKKGSSGASANSATLTLSNFSSFSPPSGTTVKIAVAVRSSRTGSATTHYAKLRLNKSGGSCDITLNDLTTTLTTTEYSFCSGVTPSTLTSIDVIAYNNSTSNDFTMSIDGIQMRWSETTTTTTTILAAQSGKVTSVPGSGTIYSAIGTAGAGDNADALWLGGITYLPLSRVTVDVETDNEAIFTRAAILRSLYVNTSASTMAKGATIGDVTTTLSSGSLTINGVVDGQTWISSHVQYDVSGNAVTATTIDNWIVRR